MFTLNVAYKGLPEFQGKELTFDQKIERAVGKKTSGSGYFFPKGERDLSFSFRAKEKAEEAMMKALAFAKTEKRKIKCRLFVDD